MNSCSALANDTRFITCCWKILEICSQVHILHLPLKMNSDFNEFLSKLGDPKRSPVPSGVTPLQNGNHMVVFINGGTPMTMENHHLDTAGS